MYPAGVNGKLDVPKVALAAVVFVTVTLATTLPPVIATALAF
jgi:hypothetical protein